MKYYLIVGEASGDLHASHLMQSLKEVDKQAEFRFFGGDLMEAVGGTRVRHYRDLAYMGLIPVLLHLPTILKNMSFCKQDITSWQPDCVILVDYPGFNLNIAKYLHTQRQTANRQQPTANSQQPTANRQQPTANSQQLTANSQHPQIYYYISPKIWAWKEHRIKAIKRDIDELFSILPFEVDFFEQKHHYPIHYVGNPTADEVREWLKMEGSTFHLPLSSKKPIALLAGSRKQEIKDNLPTMIEAVKPFMSDYRIVLAGAPGIEPAYYDQFIQGSGVEIVFNKTYPLLAQAHAALVTSGTATLETACFNVPQVVCYKLPLPRIASYVRKWLIKVKYVSLVNLIADREVVTEVLDTNYTVAFIRQELEKILDGPARQQMLDGYAEVRRRLGDQKAPDNAARIIFTLLTQHSHK